MKRTALIDGLTVACLLLASSPFFAFAQEDAPAAQGSSAAAQTAADGGAQIGNDAERGAAEKEPAASSVK